MAIQTRKSLKQTLLESLNKIGEISFPLLGTAKQTYIQTPLSAADRLNQEANRLTQLAEQEKDINRKRELYRQSLNLSQQAAQLSQKSASNVPKVVGATQLGTDILGVALGGTLGAASKGAKAVKGLAQSTSGGISNIITSKLLPEQMKAVEEQRLKDVVQTYRQKYPQANIPTTLPIEQQEKAYQEYIKAPYTQRYKPTLPTGYQEPTTATGQFTEGLQAGVLNTLIPSAIKSAQTVLNKVGLYDASTKLENEYQKRVSYAQSRLDLQSPDFAKMFKENPTKAAITYVARAFGETLPYTGAMVVAPLLTRKVNYWTVVAPLQFIEKGNFLRDIENQVKDKALAENLATIYGGINAVIEDSLGYTPAGLAKWLSQPVQRVSQNTFLKVVKSLPRTVVSALVNSINEGNEELLQQISENILRKWAGDKNVQTTFSELAQNWLGGFAGSLPLGVSRLGTTQAGLTVQPTFGQEIVGQTDKSGRTIIEIAPLENTYVVRYMDKTGKVDGLVLTPDKYKEYLQQNFPEVQISTPKITPEIQSLIQERDRLLAQNTEINERLSELEDREQIGTSEYNNLENKRKQNGIKIQELTNKINTLSQTTQPVETPVPAPTIQTSETLTPTITNEQTLRELKPTLDEMHRNALRAIMGDNTSQLEQFKQELGQLLYQQEPQTIENEQPGQPVNIQEVIQKGIPEGVSQYEMFRTLYSLLQSPQVREVLLRNKKSRTPILLLQQPTETLETPKTPEASETPKTPATPETQDNKTYAVNRAILRLAETRDIPKEELPTHEVENIKQISQATAEFYDSLSPEQKDEYIQNGQLPPTVSKPIFADLYEKEHTNDEQKFRLLLESPIYKELTEQARALREQREVVSSRVEVVQTLQEAKRQRVSKRLGVKIDDLEDKIKVVNRRLTHQINLQTLSDFIVQHPQLRNPELVDAVRLGEVNLLELATHPYEDIVDTLSPYIQDPELLRQAALELQGKQFLQRITTGVTYWIKKWGIAEPSFSDKKLTQLVNQFLAQLQPKQLTWQEQQKILKQFTETLSGYILSDEELKKAMEIADVLITTRSLPDFKTLPADDPQIVKYAQAELSFLHLKDEIEGLNINLPQWWQSVHQTILSTWKEQGFWKAADTVFKELNDLSIALKASLDNSFIFRQGRYTLLSNPKAWLEGAKKSFEAWFKSNPSQVIDSYLLDYFKDPLYRNGFYVKTNVATVNSELYPTTTPSKLPLIGNLFQRSESAYTLAQIEMRKGVAKYMWNLYQGHSITVGGETRTIDFLTNKNDLQAAKEIIGVSTASGLTERRGISRYLVWSRNLITSDLKTFSNLVGAWTSDIPEFKKVQIKQAWTRLVGILAFQYLINILLRSIYKDWDENPIVIDPTDQRFGEIYLGKDIKFRDPLLTIVNLVCTVGSTALGKGYRSRTTRERVKVGQYGFDPFGDLIVGYFQNKFTPAARILIDIVNNEMFGGKKITVGRIGEALFTPIVLENISELKDVEKWRQPSAIIAVIADAFGLSTTTMIHRVQLDKTIADEVDRLQGLDIPDIQAGRYDGFINEFKSLSTKENQRFFEVLSEQLNTQLTRLIESKPYQAASDEQKADAIQRLYDNIFHTTKIYWIQHKLNQCKTQEEGYQLLHKYTEQGFLNDELYRDLVQYGVIPYSLIQYAQSKQK